MLQPYLALRMPLRISPEVYYSSFPMMLGAGFQASVRGFGSGGFFVDAGILTTMNGIEMHNRRVFTPNPNRILYNHFVVEFSIGYKFGFLDRVR